MYMVQMEALSTPDSQEGVQSQGGQQREEYRVVHHVQVEYYQGNPGSYPLQNSKFEFLACPY